MDLLAYLNGRASLTEFEANVFGIGELMKGWKKRGASLEITESMLNEIYTHFEHRQLGNAEKKAFKRVVKAIRDIKREGRPALKKYLYVMQNSYGDLKIGISIDPFRRARQLTTGSGSTVECLAYWDTEKPANEVESFLLSHYTAFRKEGEWFEPHSFTLEDVASMMPCKKIKVFSVEDDNAGEKNVSKKSLTDTEEYEYLHIKHETPKAILFNIMGHDIWVAKSSIKTLNSSRHLVKVRIGMISDKLKLLRA